MSGPAPEEVVRILRTARTSTPDPRLDPVLEGFRRHLLSVARRRRPGLEDDFEDAVQRALIDLIDPDVLESLRDPKLVQAWARTLFLHKLDTLGRERRRERARRQPIPDDAESVLDWLAERLAADGLTPEEQAILNERLEIVAACLKDKPLAQAKFVDDLSDKELAIRFGKTNAAVRNYLKRLRQLVRTAVAERS